MTALGREAALSSGTLSAAIDRMEKAQLVKRIADPSDGRGVKVTAADWSPAKRKRLFTALLATEDAMLAPLSRHERETLLTLLSRVLDGMGESKA